MIRNLHNNHRRRCLKEVLWNSAARLAVFHSEFLHPLHKIFFLLYATIAQNIVLLYSTLAQNISLFCSTLAQNIFSLFSTLAQNRIFKFGHLMCKIEFLGWSKSCTKYSFCSTLAQKKEIVVQLYCKLESWFSPTKNSIGSMFLFILCDLELIASENQFNASDSALDETSGCALFNSHAK